MSEPHVPESGSSARPSAPSATAQLLGFLLGGALGCGLGLGAWVLAYRLEPVIGPRVLLVVVLALGFVQFAWLIPLALWGWRRRNIGVLVGVISSSFLLLTMSACLGLQTFVRYQP